MNAVTQTEARAVTTAATMLQAADPSKHMILVPLSRLVLRPTGRNVRKTTPRMSIPELAASIQRVGLLQNLIVIPANDGENYEVVAGGRRLAALKLLAKKHRIAKDWDVPCLQVADGTARTASLTENVQREAMHPADQFEAFAALVAEGRPIEDIAADFSVTPLVLRYQANDYCCLHQDLYGDHVFPFQAIFLLNEPGRDFEGGELLLTESNPKMPGRADVVPLRQGDAVVLAVNYRPVRSARGFYRANLRHGVSRLHEGQRHTLGIIFHDAK